MEAMLAQGQLSLVERDELARHEATIERGLKTFVEVGEALAAIRDGHLYRTSHATFELYCRERWGITRQHANRTIAAAEVVGRLEPMGSIPTSERQVRPLRQLPEEEQPEAWARAVETAPEGKPTAAHVQAVVDAYPGRPEDLIAGPMRFRQQVTTVPPTPRPAREPAASDDRPALLTIPSTPREAALRLLDYFTDAELAVIIATIRDAKGLAG